MALPYVYGNFAWTGMDYKVNPAPKTPQNISPRLLKHVFGDLLPLLCPHARMRAHTHHPPPLPTNKKGGQAGHRKLKNAVSLRLSMAVLSFSLSLFPSPPLNRWSAGRNHPRLVRKVTSACQTVPGIAATRPSVWFTHASAHVKRSRPASATLDPAA